MTRKSKFQFHLPGFHKKAFLGANWLEKKEKKRKEGIVSDVLDVPKDPNSLPDFKATFPLQEEKNEET